MEKIFNFTAKFFESLKCKLSWDGEVLRVENVPENFEKTYKKSPYFFIFDKKNIKDGRILVAPGEEFFNLMTGYLKNSASTTLLKINFEINPEKIIEKQFFFKNCQISGIKKTYENSFFYRFMFQTNFTYLNKKEKEINEVYVHNREVVKGSLEGYPVEDGKKEDVSKQEIEKNYEIAKNKVKEIVKGKTEDIALQLNKKLDTAKERIKQYCERQIKEREEKIKNVEEKIIQIKSQPASSEIERKEALEKIDRHEKNIQRIKEELDIDKIRKEEAISITDEEHKHSLNVDNNLLNTTVIYYPVFKFLLSFDKNIKKSMEIRFDPLMSEISKVYCNKCKKEIRQVNLCENGHVACDSCIGKCLNCGDYYCEDCLKDLCQVCHSRICKKCKVTCKKCHKSICKKHVEQDSMTGEYGCSSCLKECPKCHKTSDPKTFKKDAGYLLVCRACIAKDTGKNIIDKIFS